MKQSNLNYFPVDILFLTALFLFVTGCVSTSYEDKQAVIDSISAKWVPDKREGICSVTISPGKKGTIVLHGETTSHQAKQEITEALTDKSFQIIDSITTFPDTLSNDHFMGVVSLSVINLRKEPRHSSELVSQAIMGTPVMILKSGNSWLLIQTPDKYIAWTEKSSVTLMTSSELRSWKGSEKVIFQENSGLVFANMEETEIVSDLVAGCQLLKTGELNDFVKVQLPDGREGLIRKINIDDFKSWSKKHQITGDDIVRVALKYRGLPYLWGGTSSKAVDCSGFVESVYFMNGVILPRDAALQGRHGMAVDISHGLNMLEKGDLLFFGSARITHVGIYKGDSEFIHASSYVMVNSLDSLRSNYSSFRKRTLLEARRIIGTENDNGIVPISEHNWYK